MKPVKFRVWLFFALLAAVIFGAALYLGGREEEPQYTEGTFVYRSLPEEGAGKLAAALYVPEVPDVRFPGREGLTWA